MIRITKIASAILAACLSPALALATVSVTITPATVHVLPGNQVQFTATVTGGSSGVVLWSLSGTNCSGVACGQITSTGLYSAPSAPPSPDVVTVTATALADLTASASAAVIVGSSSDITVTVSPATANVLVSQQQIFTAFVSGTTITDVTWSLTGAGCNSGSGCGSINRNGIYIAPATPPTPAQVTIVATSAADPSRTGTAVLTVTLPIAVSVAPASVELPLGGRQQFSATVTNTSDTAVTWSIAGSECSGASCGAITTAGLYTAPATASANDQVTVTATSVADPSKSASAVVTLSPVSVAITPGSANLSLGATQKFSASVSGAINQHVTWTVSGSGCSGSSCGAISSTGLYTAPATAPANNQITVTAASVADPTKSASALVTLSPVSVSIAPTSASLALGATQKFTASVTGAADQKVTWSIAGSECSGASCGAITTAGLYTAPATASANDQVTVTATSVADPTKSASATVTLATVSVSVSPTAATLILGATQKFTASVSGATNRSVTWSISSSGCSGASCGIITSAGLYTAPATVSATNPVEITATSVADPAKSASATVTLATVSVSVSPSAASVTFGGTQAFTASVSGATNQNVTWSVGGSGCSGTVCGTISSAGLYTAPATAPASNHVTVTATSVADPTRSASATVTFSAVAVSVSPTSATLALGASKQFTATVSGSSNESVSWSLSGSGCSGTACGSITSAGLYTAPATAPSADQITVTATSVADPSQSASATVTLLIPVSISVTPVSANIVLGATQKFTATVSGTPNQSVTWSVAGSGCTGTACGTITSAGLYTAPATAPSADQVTVTATSVADPTKSASATVTLIIPVSVSVTPSAVNVALGASRQFNATVTGTSDESVTWSLSGSGCTGASCGTITSAGLYTAPFAIPSPARVRVTATSVADPTKSGSAIVTVIPPIVVTISPATATVEAGAQQQFLATISGTTNSSVTWSVSGTGCSGDACGTISTAGLYTAPATLPTPALVTVKVTPAADTARFAEAAVTLVPPVVVTISPTSANVVAGAHRQFAAVVTGTANTAVTWSVSGTGCAGSACGVMSTTGLYSAPAAVPNPATVTVRATSVADSTKSAAADVTILPGIVVNVAPAIAQVVVNNQQQFTATVTGTSNTGVSWSLSGAGCSGSACGSVSSTGLYTAPPAVPSSPTVTLTARSAANANKSGTATIIIIPPVSVTISPASLVLALRAKQQFRASVSGSSNTAVQWSVSGAGCEGNACGTITAKGVYTAPGTIPSPATIAVTAASVIDPSQSASAAVTLVANANQRLNGKYAFQFTGFDSGAVYQAAGEFTSDGAGNITNGLEDVNSTAGPAASVPLTGTYAIGADNRGTMNFSTSGGTQTFSFTLNFANTKGRLIEVDDTGISGSGSFELQDPAAFTSSALKGAWVLSLAGRDSADDRIGALGLVASNGSGVIVAGSLDVNDGGRVPPTYSSVSGTYLIAPSGRGTLNLSIPGFLGGSFQFGFYVVSAQKVFLVSIDPLNSASPIFAGPAELQTGAPYLSASFTGPTVFSLSGEENNVPLVRVGQIVFDGISQPKVDLDQNEGGVTMRNKLYTGGYSVSVNGTGNLDLDDSNGHELMWDMYAIDPNHAFLMDIHSTAVGMGELLPQSAQPPFSGASALGTYWLGSGEPLVSTATLSSGFVNFDGNGAASGTDDVSAPAGDSLGQSLSGSYAVSSPLDPRAVLVWPASSESFALWIASNEEILGVELDATNQQPIVLYFEQ